MQTILTLDEGPWDLDGELNGQRDVEVLVVAGLVVRDVLIGGVASSELLGPGDLAVHHSNRDAQLPARVRWSAAKGTRVAVLDLASLTHAPNWERVAQGLLRRANEQLRRGALHLAIAHLPRVEDRVLMLMWHLAERWGRVGTAGMIVPLELTHEAIGRLVGARRPTVSLALKALAADGAVVRRPDGTWLLGHGAVDSIPATPGATLHAIAAPVLTATPPVRRDPATMQMLTLDGDGDGPALADRLSRLRAEHEQSLARTAAILERARVTREQVRRRREARPAP